LGLKAAAFLDRDGVLNASIMLEGVPCPPRSISEVEILPGVRSAVELLIHNGYLPIVITNQPDIARGSKSISDIKQINEHIGNEIGLSNFYICPHEDADLCACRKPMPGLIQLAAEELGIDLSKSFLVGDRWRDIQAGQAVDLPTFFIDYSYHESAPKQPFTRVNSLLEAVCIRLGVSDGFNN
jgi:D-glycero-D-manno-heptose 1,7-bisphosphate phosphatase